MSRTFSSCSRESSENGSVAVTSFSIASSSHSRSATIETRCWASTSSGLRGMTVSSISPRRMRPATTAHSSRSARNFGKIRPLETSPTLWPARPTRWIPRATDFGDSTWITRSTAPMSMPSSSDEVATRHGQLARLQQLLDDGAAPRAPASRGGLGRSPQRVGGSALGGEDPVVLRAGSSSCGTSLWSSFRRFARRSAPRRLLTKMIVEVCSRTRRSSSGRSPARSSAGSPARIQRRLDPDRDRPSCRRPRRARSCRRPGRRSRGPSPCGRRR